MAETTANVTPEPTEDSLMGSAVAKKFPGFGKELWDGEIIDGPDPKGRWCVYWARDDSTTWHSRSMLEKILTRRGPAADDDAPAAAEPAAAAAATTEMPPLPPETPREAMPPLPPPTPTEAASLQQPPRKKAPYKCTTCGKAKKSDCVCPKKPAPRGKKKSKLPKTDEPLEAIESRFLGEDEDQRELEACRERKGALDEEAERLRRELAETRAAQAQAPPAAPEKKKPKKRPPKKAFEVGSIVDADCKAFGPQYVEAARNGGPKKFRGVIVATPPNSDHWNVEYDDDGETFATEARHLTLVSEPTKKKAKPNEVCVVCGLPTVDEDGRPQDDVILCADDVSHECHLKCSGVEAGSANSMHWRCPACDQKKCQELSLQENDLTSPWVGLEAHRLVRELVKGLQREYKQLLVSGQRIDENTHDVTLSHADACELYGKAVFWEGASADLTARGGLLYSQLEVGEAEDWRRKPRSISLFPSGRVVKTVECLAAWKSTSVSHAIDQAPRRWRMSTQVPRGPVPGPDPEGLFSVLSRYVTTSTD